MSELRQTPIYRALHRPNFFFGGDRKLMLALMCGAGGMMFAFGNWYSFFVGAALGIFGVIVLRKAGKADPLWFAAYLRQRRYQGYYSPYSRPSRVSKEKGIY